MLVLIDSSPVPDPPAPRPSLHLFATVASPGEPQVACRVLFTTDPLEVTWTFVSGFFGQEKTRGIKVDNWINEYKRLHSDDESRYSTWEVGLGYSRGQE